MIRCALAEMRSPLDVHASRAQRVELARSAPAGRSRRRCRSRSACPGRGSPRGSGAASTPRSPRTIVWPALLPPWKRTTASPCSASRSVILPLPSSPHWAPTITIPGMSWSSLGDGPGPSAAGPRGSPTPSRAARVSAASCAERVRARRRALRRSSSPNSGRPSPQISTSRETVRAPSCSIELVGHQVASSTIDRALVLVAGVDDRVELLEHPVGRGSRRRGRRCAAGRPPRAGRGSRSSPPRCSIDSRSRLSSRGSE